MPKNYSCETIVGKGDDDYKVSFDFIVKVVTYEGPFICERVPINIYRVKDKKK